MASSVYARLDFLDRVVKPTLMIVCRNPVEITAFAMIPLLVIHANVHPVTRDSHAKQISTIANRHHAIGEHALMVIIHSHVNVIRDTRENFAKFKSTNANQVSQIKLHKKKLNKITKSNLILMSD